MTIMGVSGNISAYTVVYLDIERDKALVHEKKRIRVGGLFLGFRREDMLDVAEDGFGWRIQMLGPCM